MKPMMKIYLRRLLLASQFLTIVPIRIEEEVSPEEVTRSAAYFPVVGGVQGMLAIISASVFSGLFSAEITACLVLTLGTILNGGFHLDGVADTFDALAVKSSGDKTADRVKRLAVMKDSTTGAIGVVSLVIVLLLKYLLIANTLLYSASVTRNAVLFLAPALSKWVMVQTMYLGSPARNDGLGRTFIKALKRSDAVAAFLVAFFFFLVFTELLQYTHYSSAAAALLIASFAVLYVFSRLWVALCGRVFGGLTGDTVGAAGEFAEIIFLMVAGIWLRHSI